MTTSTASFLCAGLAVLFAIPTAARAQTVFTEVEPNSNLGNAQIVNCMMPGDSITGTTTGTVFGANLSTIDTYDIFQVQTCVLPAGIYRHKFTLSSPILGQNTGELFGIQVNATGCGAANTLNQTTVQPVIFSVNNEHRFDAFGKSEGEFFYLTGTPGTTMPYTVTLSNTTITPVVIGPFATGQITITTANQGNPANLDTGIAVYDSTFTLVPGFQNDDECPIVGTPDRKSTLIRTFTPGTYYLAVGTWLFVTEDLSPTDESKAFQTPNNLWVSLFDNAIFEGGGTGPINFAVIDAAGTTPVTTTKNFFYDLRWFKFTVATPSAGTLFCVPGSTTPVVMACPCGNVNGASRGCANAGPTGLGNPGASLNATGSASLAANSTDPGSLTLTGTNMFAGTACIFIQGSTIVGGGSVAFGAGVRCVGGVLVRLYVKTGLDVAGGTMTAPTGADRSIPNKTSDLFPASPIVPGTYYYQCYYRDPGLVPPTPGGLGCPPNFTFNISSGQSIVWTL